jgi:hypothetical protein
MTRRRLLAAATLSATLTLTACNGSPNAGQPNTTPPPSPQTTPTPTPSAPAWTEEEQAAITAAKSRYTAARAAANAALRDPGRASRDRLVKAGNGGAWLIAILGEIEFQKNNGWYQTGDVTIASTVINSVTLTGEQPEVRMTSCIDGSKVVTRYQSNGKPVPMGPNDGTRHKVQARLVFAPPTDQTTKIWFLIEEKRVAGKC